MTLNRKRQIDDAKTPEIFYAELRNKVIEEVAVEIEKFRVPFDTDTVSSFAIYIRSMKT